MTSSGNSWQHTCISGDITLTGLELRIPRSTDLLLSDELSVDEKSSRDINSSSLSVSFREKIALRDFLRHTTKLVTSLPGHKYVIFFTTSGGMKKFFLPFFKKFLFSSRNIYTQT